MKPEPTRRGRMGDRLVAQGALTEEELQVALKEQRRHHRPLGEILTSLGFVSEEEVTRLLAEDMGLPFLRAGEIDPDPLLLSALDPGFVRESCSFPFALRDGVLWIAMLDPGDPGRLGLVRERFPYRLEISLTTERDLEALTRRHLQAKGSLVAELLASVESGEEGEFPTEEIAKAILTDAINRHATDIHIEPEERVARLRYRVDGILQAGESLPVAVTPAIVSRFKVIANLDVSERRRPQDGRIQMLENERQIEMRVSIMPTRNGENMVLRVLDGMGGGGVVSLGRVGLPPRTQSLLQTIIGRPHGLFLVTGPTGSGKTTTLYAMLSEIDAMRRKVATIEDPIEYTLPLLRQSQVDRSVGFDFENGLRSLLRQDPDVVLVGEIRDEQTAAMAVRASLTGHLVLSTLHTNTAVGVVPRLLDMGLQPYLIEDTLIGAMSQRLVRTNCPSCLERTSATEEESAWLGVDGAVLAHGAGCDACDQTGYMGRTCIQEMFLVDETSGAAIRRGAGADELVSLARDAGYRPMEEDGKRLVRAGTTTMAEVLRVGRGHRLVESEREAV